MNKILYIHHGTSQGGAPRSMSFLIKALDAKNYEPYVLCGNDAANIPLFEKAGAKVFFDKIIPFHGSTVSGMTLKLFGKSILGILPTVRSVKKALKEIKPDIVHLNSTCLFWAARAVKKYNPNIPIICHVREPLLPNVFGSILRIGCKKYVDRFIAIEKFDAESLGDVKKPIDIIYNFVDFNTYNCDLKSSVLRSELNIQDDECIFLILARLVSSNGVLEAAKAFASSNLKAHLVMVGDVETDNSEYIQEVRKLAQENKNIHILGFRSDVPEIIASCDVMICPFTQPHFARAVIEAGAMKKPSIVSDIGGLEELVVDNNTGMFFNPQNFDTLIDKCWLLCENRELVDKLGEGAYVFATENFNAELNAQKTIDIYEQLL